MSKLKFREVKGLVQFHRAEKGLRFRFSNAKSFAFFPVPQPPVRTVVSLRGKTPGLIRRNILHYL